MLNDLSENYQVYPVTGYTDLRRSIDGLATIVQARLELDPFSSALFLFCGKRCDRIKILFREPTGFVLLYKRLSGTGRYRWPRDKSEARPLTWQELDWLLSGLDIEQPRAIRAG